MLACLLAALPAAAVVQSIDPVNRPVVSKVIVDPTKCAPASAAADDGSVERQPTPCAISATDTLGVSRDVELTLAAVAALIPLVLGLGVSFVLQRHALGAQLRRAPIIVGAAVSVAVAAIEYLQLG